MSEDILKIVIAFTFIGAWIVNLVKLISCALNEQIGLSIVHGVGLIGPLSLITVWF